MRIVDNNNKSSLNIRALFCCLWVLVFVLYLPAARAGFVADFTGWLDQIKNHSFSDYINRTNFSVVSLYQFTQFVTWVFYQLFGTNVWLWHLLFLTLHVINACLLATLSGGLLYDSGAKNYQYISYTGAVLFCVTPYISEVIVWEPSFHYLQGLLMLLLILVWVQRYIHTQQRGYIFAALFVYLLSTHSLEVFYITPWLVLSLALFYAGHQPYGKKIFGNVLRYFFLPMLVLFVLRLVEYRLLHGDWVSRIGAQTVLSLQDTGLGKPAKYLFHLLLLGRYLPEHWHIASATLADIKKAVYDCCDSAPGMIVYYGISVVVLVVCTIRFRKLSGSSKVAALLFLWVFICLLLITPLWFGSSMLVIYDRYSYFAGAFLFMLVAVAMSAIPNKYIRAGLLLIFVLANLRYTLRANRFWGKSAAIIDSLLHNIPVQDNKIVLLLNLPECMHGVLMIDATTESEFKLMHNLLLPQKKINNPVRDVMAYNMQTPEDGAHVAVLNDSTIRVTLNQWGTWWWYEAQGGQSYKNEDYRVNMIDAGHYYEITLSKPAAAYQILYQVADRWKEVDMSKRDGEQH